MAASVDVPASYRRALSRIDYTSPVCKINIAVNRSANCTNSNCTALLRIPNFLADPNSSPDCVMPHHRATIHLNCETSHLIEEAYRHAVTQTLHMLTDCCVQGRRGRPVVLQTDD